MMKKCEGTQINWKRSQTTFLFEKSDPNKSETVTILTRHRTRTEIFPQTICIDIIISYLPKTYV